MSVSIIIPVYKVEKFIRRCLLSVIAQDYKDIEIIIVDDCTPDKSIQVAIDTLKESDTNYKIIVHEQNKGLSGARNTGIKNASGDFLYFLDSDDELHDSTCISSLLSVQEQTGADFVCGNYERVYNGHIYVSKRYSNQLVIKGNNNIIEAFANGSIPITAWNKLISKEFIIKAGLYFKEGIINEDELWTFNTIINAHVVALSGKTTYNYYMNENSIMNSSTSSRILSAIEVYKELAVCFSKHFKQEKHLSTHINRFAFFRHLEIISLNEPMSTKRNLYKRLREYQKNINIKKDMKGHIMHAHLLFPPFIGFRIMQFTALLYNRRKK